MNETNFQQQLRDNGFGEGQIKSYPPERRWTVPYPRF